MFITINNASNIMSFENMIQLNDGTLEQIAHSGLDLPFVVLNIDTREKPDEPHLHRMACSYLDSTRLDGMQPDSKQLHHTGSHWLLVENNAPRNATRNCNCWKLTFH